jgi:ABC-type siderophore export system fused ATPase/permease subunit
MFNILLMQMVRKPSQINHDVKTVWEAMKRSPSSVILLACSSIFVWFVGGLTVVLTKVVMIIILYEKGLTPNSLALNLENNLQEVRNCGDMDANRRLW